MRRQQLICPLRPPGCICAGDRGQHRLGCPHRRAPGRPCRRFRAGAHRTLTVDARRVAAASVDELVRLGRPFPELGVLVCDGSPSRLPPDAPRLAALAALAWARLRALPGGVRAFVRAKP
jgi:hypothetical protein